MTHPNGTHPNGSASRRMLARVRDIMAGSGTGQERLDHIVTLLKIETQADVCSCYVMRAGEVLELFSTEGLNKAAVHKTRLRVGEGIVGDIAANARPIALDDAPSHPNFAYRPETGEDPFQSLMGVPILRGGRVRGVLVIQHKARRAYLEDEVESLQTIAMVVAELVAAGELVSPNESFSPGDVALLPTRLSGTALNSGLAQGVAVIHRPQLTIRQMVADDVDLELERLSDALAAMHSAIDELLARTALAGLGESRDILETYRMFAEDRGWLTRIREAIRMGLTAEAAVQQVQNDNRARMSHLTDPYIRERVLDLDDLTNRLLQHLAGKSPDDGAAALPDDDIVLIARSMGPAELLDYYQRRLRALILEEGSPSSHVCIVARALDIPVVQCADALNRIEALDPLIVDGDNAVVFVRPAEDIQMTFANAMELRVRREQMYAEVRALPSLTRDGVPISIQLNCGLIIDLPHLHASGAEGIGLYRTEIPFMVRPTYPDVDTQTELYRRILTEAGDKPVIFRTLDVGGDKVLPYLAGGEEENPALGWRAIRIGLDHPMLLRQQLRALLRAAAGRTLSVMFPMVAEVAEFEAARHILGLEVAHALAHGFEPPSRLRVGAMIEVPSLLFQLPALLPRVDFVSVGSNDLAQYLFASDRGNPRTGTRYDSLSPAMLSMLRRLVDACREAEVPLSICGEMAGRPLDAMALIGIGFRTLSMAPPAVGPVKTMLRSLDVAALRQYLSGLYHCPDHSLRTKLRAFAKDHGVII